jgi:meso-butanediol dehydrogenase/(S,S)-butanediol dehydrogenase/diacetyl reductase
MKRRLENLNALITGGTKGIGRAIATRYAEEGANLFLCARSAGPLDNTSADLRKLGAKVVSHAADVSDQKSVKEMVQHAIKELGEIDILVNNAGYAKSSPFLDYSLEEFEQTIKVNLYGVFHVSQAVLPGMIKRKKGKVINIASTGGKWGSRNQSVYNASKHGVVGLTRCMALEMAPYKINVNAICPYTVETEMILPLLEKNAKLLEISSEEILKRLAAASPLGRIIQPADVAHLAVYLASEESDSMTAQSISVCGGYLMI